MTVKTEDQNASRLRPGGRSARVRSAVLAATRDLLAERGFEGTELPEVARRAGVHSTTVYRRWGTKARLVGEALLDQAATLTPTPDTGALRTDLERLLVDGASLVRTPAVRALFEVLLTESTDPSPEIARARDRFWAAHLDEARTIVERAIARSELPRGTEPTALVELLIGPALLRTMLMGRDLGACDAAEIVTRAISALAAGDHPRGEGHRTRLHRVPTNELTAHETAAIRELLWSAYGSDEEGFTEDDWEHAIGGMHFVLEIDGEIVAHASVVEREFDVDGRPLKTGYVEAVATAPDRQGEGFGSLVMSAVTSWIRERFELGALGTGRHAFYERLGWLTWKGPSSVRTAGRPRRTPDEDGDILVLPTGSSPELDLEAPISCDWRPGDVW